MYTNFYAFYTLSHLILETIWWSVIITLLKQGKETWKAECDFKFLFQ